MLDVGYRVEGGRGSGHGGALMRGTTVDAGVGATERADLRLDLLHQPTRHPTGLTTGPAADRAGEADAGEGPVETGGGTGRLHGPTMPERHGSANHKVLVPSPGADYL